MDAASESLVNEAIANISASHQLTTILIAHRCVPLVLPLCRTCTCSPCTLPRSLSTLKTADVVVMMENGVVAEQGTYDELSREGTRFNYLVRSQLLGAGPSLTAGVGAGAGAQAKGAQS